MRSDEAAAKPCDIAFAPRLVTNTELLMARSLNDAASDSKKSPTGTLILMITARTMVSRLLTRGTIPSWTWIRNGSS